MFFGKFKKFKSECEVYVEYIDGEAVYCVKHPLMHREFYSVALDLAYRSAYLDYRLG